MMSLTYSDSFGETKTATWFAGLYEPFAGSSVLGLGPVAVAVTVTPARRSASMNAVRANAAGSCTWKVCTTGALPAGTVPLSSR